MKKPTKAKPAKKAPAPIDLAYKAFAKWNKLNNVGKPWENSLGPKSKTIRENLFIAGWLHKAGV